MREDQPYEQALCKRIARGEEAAFREIFDRYKQPFYAAALKMIRSEAVAEEIVQDVFVHLWQHRTSLAGVEQVSSYLFSVVYHQIYRHFRQLARQRQLTRDFQASLGEAAENSTETLLSLKEYESTLRQAVDELPPQQQVIYRLSKQEGFSREEIADLLHISPHTVKNHLLRAIKHLRGKLHYPLFLLISCLF